MSLREAFRDVADRALVNVGFPERSIKGQAIIAETLRGTAKEDRRKKQTRLSLSEAHEVVYGCIRAISNTIAEIPIVLHNGETIVEDRNDRVLRLLNAPNETMGRPQLMLSIAWMLMASGNSFTEVGFQRREPVALWPIIADAVDIEVGTNKRITGYKVHLGRESVSLRPQEVLHIKLFHPRDGYHGLSPIAALEQGVLADLESVQYNKTLYENMAVPLGILKTEQEVTPNKGRQLVQEWNEKLRSGAGSVALLGRGMDWEPLTISPKDLYYIQSRELTRRQVQTVYGCSDLFLGEAGVMPFAGSVSAIRVFYENTIFPLLSQIQYVFNNQLLSWFDGEYWLEFDRNRIPFLMELLQEKAKTHADLLRAGLTQKLIWPILWNHECPLPEDIANISYVPVDVIQAGVWNQSVAGPAPGESKAAALALRELAARKDDALVRDVLLEIRKLHQRIDQLQEAL